MSFVLAGYRSHHSGGQQDYFRLDGVFLCVSYPLASVVPLMLETSLSQQSCDVFKASWQSTSAASSGRFFPGDFFEAHAVLVQLAKIGKEAVGLARPARRCLT